LPVFLVFLLNWLSTLSVFSFFFLALWFAIHSHTFLCVVEATKNVELGNKELSPAIQRNSSSRTFPLLFLFVLTFSIIFLDWYSWISDSIWTIASTVFDVIRPSKDSLKILVSLVIKFRTKKFKEIYFFKLHGLR
jgi:hypothetical protein